MSTQPVTLANPGGLPACMGGWCGLRDCCGQAQALDRRVVVERLCANGQTNAWVEPAEAGLRAVEGEGE